ncbi:putative RNA polymerase II transcription factor SIII subunit A,putative [Aspergillus unguis]
MSPPTLRQLCTTTAIRNVKYLNDIGNIPYALARPFLLKIESPEKLRSLELQSPHLMNDDSELWLDFIKRDIPRWDEYELPEQPDCWYDIYCELREEIQRAVDEDAEKLKMALEGISSERAKHSTKFVDRRTARLPVSRPTARQRYASYDRKRGGISSASYSSDRPSSFRTAGSAPKKNNIFTASRRNNALTVPTKQLNNRATRVSQAPRALIEDHRRPTEPPPAARRPSLRVPGRSSQNDPAPSSSHSSTLQEREARLRAIAAGRAPSSSQSRTPLSASSMSASSRPSGALPTSSESQSRVASPANVQPKSRENMNSELRRSPPRATMRKRPASNPLMQPKKKRVH